MERNIDYFKDDSVVNLLNKGDKTIFEEAYIVFAPRLFRHAFLRTSSQEVAEEITSETFLRTWRSIIQGNRITNLRAFLFRTLHHLLIDYYREKGRQVMPISAELIDNLIVGESEQNSALKAEQKRWMLEALSRLHEEYRMMITWRYIDELSIQEIGQIAGKSTNAVYVTLHRALKALRKIIDRIEDFPD